MEAPMANGWSYSQSSGELCLNGELKGTGYSGRGAGRNNPAMQAVKNVGPIPQGSYRIHVRPGKNYPQRLGAPPVMSLVPAEGTNTFGRSGFFIHGNNRSNDASHGCIVMDHGVRVAVAQSGDRDLLVVA
jgi:type VI secretion system (T6SS) effector TldE1-like protein